MLTAQVERLADCLEELKPLFELHFDRVASGKEYAHLNPNYQAYLEVERQGLLLTIILRSDERAVGYWIAFLIPSLHYQDCLTATCDVWAISPDYVGTIAPLILMRSVEKEYRSRKVMRSFVAEKIEYPSERILKLFNYKPIEKTYEKWMVE